MSQSHHRCVPVVLAIVVVLTLSGCFGTRRSPDELRLMLEHDLPTLDPALSTATNSGKLVALLYSTLLTYDENGSLAPELATTWTVSPDGLAYTFTLRPDARFSHGRALVADDVKRTVERVLDPATASPRTWVFDRLAGAAAFTSRTTDAVAGVEVLDAHRVRLVLDRPFAPFPGFLTMPTAAIVPSEVAAARGPDFGRKPCGSGPFVLESWTMGSELVFRRSPVAYGTPAKVDRVVFTILNEPFTYATEFKVGNLDLIPLPASESDFFTSSPRWKDHVEARPGLNVYFIGMNCQTGPCRDLRVRQAIAHAVDPDLIVATTRKGQAVRAYGPIPPGLAGHDPAFRGMGHDPELARRLLAEAGLPAGTVLELLQDQRNENLEVTQLVASSLERVGLKVKIVPFEWGVFSSRINEGKFDLYYRSWLADYTDAENFFFPLFHSSQAGPGGNRPRYADPETDALIARVQATPDEASRIELYRRLQSRVVDAAPYVFLFHKLERYVVQPWVRGFRIFPVFNSDKLTDVALDGAALDAR